MNFKSLPNDQKELVLASLNGKAQGAHVNFSRHNSPNSRAFADRTNGKRPKLEIIRDLKFHFSIILKREGVLLSEVISTHDNIFISILYFPLFKLIFIILRTPMKTTVA